MTPAISVTGLTRRYRDHTALDDINVAISAGTITGLLGRNGAGKTTLLRILAGQEFPSSGSVRVLGAPPAENEDVPRRLAFVREDQAYPDIKVGQALRAASWFHPNWDSALASSLLRDFGVRANKFALFVYGMWHGIVYSRWGPLGTLAFIAVQVLMVVAGGVVVRFEHWGVRSAASGSSAGLTALGLTGVIAVLAVLLLAGGHATIRRATV
jgi:ABC-type Fe3+/spermidine/putrescine transport system ATPase subunit